MGHSSGGFIKGRPPLIENQNSYYESWGQELSNGVWHIKFQNWRPPLSKSLDPPLHRSVLSGELVLQSECITIPFHYKSTHFPLCYYNPVMDTKGRHTSCNAKTMSKQRISKNYIMYTDASHEIVSAVLAQECKEDESRSDEDLKAWVNLKMMTEESKNKGGKPYWSASMEQNITLKINGINMTIKPIGTDTWEHDDKISTSRTNWHGLAYMEWEHYRLSGGTVTRGGIYIWKKWLS